VGVIVRADQLRHEMVLRGLSASDLARAARLSAATVSAALAGRPVAPRTLALIAEALGRVPVVDHLGDLLDLSHDSGIE